MGFFFLWYTLLMPGDDLNDRESDFILKTSEFVAFQPNHALMARPKLKEFDMTPQRVFFLKRMDNDDPETNINVYTEQEAAMLLKSSHRFMLRIVGCSDGSTYAQFIRSKGYKAGQRIPKQEAEQVLRDAWSAELEAARGNIAQPEDQNVHFDNSFPLNQRKGFVPPA